MTFSNSISKTFNNSTTKKVCRNRSAHSESGKSDQINLFHSKKLRSLKNSLPKTHPNHTILVRNKQNLNTRIEQFGLYSPYPHNIFDGENSRSARKVLNEIHERARDLLDAINAIARVDDLKVPPSNRLLMLRGNLKDFWSVSINSQLRIIFKWDGQNAIDVEITDYHLRSL